MSEHLVVNAGRRRETSRRLRNRRRAIASAIVACLALSAVVSLWRWATWISEDREAPHIERDAIAIQVHASNLLALAQYCEKGPTLEEIESQVQSLAMFADLSVTFAPESGGTALGLTFTGTADTGPLTVSATASPSNSSTAVTSGVCRAIGM